MASSGCPSSASSSLVPAAAGAGELAQSAAAAAGLSLAESVPAPESELFHGERTPPPPEEVSNATGCPR